jgi:phosphatidate cytidylyltransferase
VKESLGKRIATASVLAAVLLVVVLGLPPIATVIVLTALVLAGGWEWSAFLRLRSLPARATYVAVLAALLPTVWYLTGTPSGRNALLAVAVSWWVIALGWIVFAPRRVEHWRSCLHGSRWCGCVWISRTARNGCCSR